MIEALYRCARGHEHRLTLPDPPQVLMQHHGDRAGFPPTCPLPLRLQSEGATTPVLASEPGPALDVREPERAISQAAQALAEPRWTSERDLADGGHVGFRIDLLTGTFIAGYRRPHAETGEAVALWVRRPTVADLLPHFGRIVDLVLLRTVGIPGAMTTTDVPGQFELLPVIDPTADVEAMRLAAADALREMCTN